MDELFFIYCTVISMNEHPGHHRDNSRMTPNACMTIATNYYQEFLKCRTQEQSSEPSPPSPEAPCKPTAPEEQTKPT